VSALLTARAIVEEPSDYVRRYGTVVAEFGHLTQDSGNVSWLVDTPRMGDCS
jgi:signal recognition particle receptor subunit beta